MGVCERNRGVCELYNVVDREKRGCRDTVEDKLRDRRKVKRQNELVFVVFSFSCSACHPQLTDG